MLPKADFGDYHKFRASVGIVLMAAGPIAAWFFFRQTFDLLTTAAELSSLSKLSRWIIYGRQALQIPATFAVVYGSYRAFRHGLRMYRDGMSGWEKSQTTIDERETLKLRIMRSGIKDQTAEETISEATQEIVTASPELQPTGGASSSDLTIEQKERLNLKVSHFLSVKALFARKVQGCVAATYGIKPNQNLRKLQYALVLFAKPGNDVPDVLLEISNAPDSKLVELIDRLLPKYSLGAIDFSLENLRVAHLVLVFIRNEQTRMSQELKQAATKAVKEFDMQVPTTVLAITEHEVRRLDCFAVNMILQIEGMGARFWTDEDLA